MVRGVHTGPLFGKYSDIFPFEKIMVEGMLKKSYRIRRKPCTENQ
jgi:hypothetical protein